MRDEITRLADKWERIGREHGVRQFTGNDHLLFANELRVALARTDHTEDKLGMVPASRDRVSEIEDAVASGAMNAMQCFTQMRQLIVKPDHSAGVGGVVAAALINAGGKLANAAFNLAQSPSLSDRERKCLDEVRKEWDAALLALAQPADADGAK